ncbi:uncharacterized protein LOC132016288 [Mustela nigripes]|uniref:uncharacterized protein LOC132016288 n=1 Tax=Mustela nigripes TaxID=77151 RepID=UPI0028152ADA|nr:uncharacterized protein LOC132016288 [Mustela nigripes]
MRKEDPRKPVGNGTNEVLPSGRAGAAAGGSARPIARGAALRRPHSPRRLLPRGEASGSSEPRSSGVEPRHQGEDGLPPLASPPSVSEFFRERRRSFPVRRGPHAERGGGSIRALRGCARGAARRDGPGPWALPRRGRGRADCEPNVEGGTSPEAAESPVLSQGATRPWVPSFLPRPRCLASRCSGTRREQRGAASAASGVVLTPPGGGLGASIPRTPDEGQNTSSPGRRDSGRKPSSSFKVKKLRPRGASSSGAFLSYHLE